MYIDPNIISLIIQEEMARKLKDSEEYGEPAELHIDIYEEMPEEHVEEPQSPRGVIVIDI